MARSALGPSMKSRPPMTLGRGAVAVTRENFVVGGPAKPEQAQRRLDQRVA